MILKHAICFSVLFLSAATVFGQGAFTSHILERTDTAAQVTPEQVDEWIAKAEKGDWQLMAEFAAAYLVQGNCEKLKFGHRCRAMTVRTEVGRKFLFQIIDAPNVPSFSPSEYPKRPEYWSQQRKFDTNSLRRGFAWIREAEAYSRKTEWKPDSEDSGCKDFIKYTTLAAENGDDCAVQLIRRSYSSGTCVKQDAEKAKYFSQFKQNCPVQ